jgi:tRNA threonylcarbamoyladenosine biosynthesis protein TsaB
MLILGLDTTLTACSAALVRADADGFKPVEQIFEWRPRGHAEVLAAMVQTLLERAKLKFNSIERIAVTCGPGTFTGVRVGLAAARGFALAAGIPVIGLTSLEAIAENHWQSETADGPLAVLVDARRGEVYCQIFSSPGNAMTQPAAGPIEEVLAPLDGQAFWAIGSAAQAAKAANSGRLRLSDALPVPDAAKFAHLVLGAKPAQPPSPLYLRAPDVKAQARSNVLPPL